MPSTRIDRIDGLSTSVAVKAPVVAVSTANLTLYGLQTVGGVALAADDRVLVKDQTDATENGIWVASETDWARAEDFDGNRDVVKGTLVITADPGDPTFYQVTTVGPIIIGTTELAFEEVTGATGSAGDDGLSVAELIIYIRSATYPDLPVGGSYDFDSKVLTAPTSWSSTVPEGGSPLYTSRAVASIQGVSGVDSTLTWSAPVETLVNGQSLDIIFKRSATQPTTPDPSLTTPATWYTNVGDVPASSDLLWSSIGTRLNADENWVWQTPIQVEGDVGAPAVLYYIKAISGTAIKNGTGTLTVEAHKLEGGTDTILSSGTIKLYVGSTEVTVANGYATGSDGYTGVFDAGDINNSVVVTLKDGAAGDPLDTITLVDIADGSSGTGTDSVYGYIETDGSIAWVRASDGSTWTPSDTTRKVDCTFIQAAAEVARVAWLITRAADGTMTGASTTHTGGDLNSGRVTVTEIGEGTSVFTIQFTYSYLGDESQVIETFYTSKSGTDGNTGERGPGMFEVAVGSSGTGYSIGSADASLWNGGTLTDLVAQEAAAYIIGASSNGYIEPRDALTIYEAGVQAATRVYLGPRTTNYASVVAGDWSSKVAQAIDGSLIVNGTISADKITVGTLSAIKADLGTITGGTITLNSSGYIRSGQTDYNVGSGFFLGRSGGTTKFSIGTAGGAGLTWDGTTLRVSNIEITGGYLRNTVLGPSSARVGTSDSGHSAPFNAYDMASYDTESSQAIYLEVGPFLAPDEGSAIYDRKRVAFRKSDFILQCNWSCNTNTVPCYVQVAYKVSGSWGAWTTLATVNVKGDNRGSAHANLRYTSTDATSWEEIKFRTYTGNSNCFAAALRVDCLNTEESANTAGSTGYKNGSGTSISPATSVMGTGPTPPTWTWQPTWDIDPYLEP